MKPTLAFRIMTIGATFGVMVLACLPSLHARTRGQLKGTTEAVFASPTVSITVSASHRWVVLADTSQPAPLVLTGVDVRLNADGSLGLVRDKKDYGGYLMAERTAPEGKTSYRGEWFRMVGKKMEQHKLAGLTRQ